MRKVNNRGTLFSLALRFLKVNSTRNLIAIFAVVLTSLLFTSVATTSISYIKSTQAAQCQMCMDYSHFGIQNALSSEYTKALKIIKKDPSVKRYGVGRFLGLATNKELTHSQTEIRYGDKNLTESFNATPTKGTLPMRKNEIACSTITLDLLGVPRKIGTPITLSINVCNNEIISTFYLSGYWEGYNTDMAQLVWVSKDYSTEIGHNLTKEDLENGIYEGGYDIFLWFHNTFFLEKKAATLTAKLGLEKASLEKAKCNPSYLTFGEDGFDPRMVLVLVCIIIISGFLIIYNIFNISIATDIRTYGLLKNIGLTGKQLKKIVYLQATLLSLVGMPIGMVIGYLFSHSLLKMLLTSSSDISEAVKNLQVMSSNPLIFLFAAVFSLLTVFAGCSKSSKIVAKLTPVEALKASDEVGTSYQSRRKRNFSKGIVVMISISLSTIILNCAVSCASGFDFDTLISSIITCDFELAKLPAILPDNFSGGITSDMVKDIEDCPDAKNTPIIYFKLLHHNVDDTLHHNLEAYYNKNAENMDNTKKEFMESYGKELDICVYGINKAAFESMELKDTSITWEKFSQGNYSIVCQPDEKKSHFYKPTESFRVDFSNNNTKQYTCLCEGQLPYSLQYPYFLPMRLEIYLPDSVFMKETKESSAMIACINAKFGKEKTVDKYIAQKILTKDPSVQVNSILKYRENFKRYTNKYLVLGSLLAGVLALIGIMNFFNTCTTSILTRKRELTLLEILGMTRKQIQRMLVLEGLIYIIGAFILATTLGSLLGSYLVQKLVGNIYYFHNQYLLWPGLCMLLFMIIVAIIEPIYQYRKMLKDPVISRL